MEKIYMEDNNKNNKKSTTNSFLKGKVVVTTSIFITIVAIVAFVATSFNNPSWAAVPAASSNLEDQFTLKLEDNSTLYSRVSVNTTSGEVYQRVPRFWANSTSGTSVFCLEEDIPVDDDTVYHVDSEDITAKDYYYGVLYILANGYYNKDSFTKNLSDEERAIVTQVALWNYLYDKKAPESDGFLSDFVEKFSIGASNFSDFHAELFHNSDITKNKKFSNLLYKDYIAKLVAEAKNASADDTKPNISATRENGDVTLTEDKKYYQSTAIVTSSNNDTKLFTVKILDPSPKGTVLVDENGVALEEGTEYSIGKKFYARFPVDSVGKEGITINLTLTTSGGYKYTGKVYRAYNPDSKEYIDGQKIIGVDVEPQDVPVDVSLEYVPGPDTAMNVSQVIYFVGLVILVCGLGIVYANVKPKESN